MFFEKSNFANLPSKHGKFRIRAYKQGIQEHLLILSKDFDEIEVPYLRVHSECLTGDALGSLKCDCQNQLDLALKFISKEGGFIIYHRQEGRNIGLLNKINAYSLQDQGRNTVEANEELGFKADERDYEVVKEVIKDLGVKKIKLITNNPKKIDFIESLGVEVVQRVPAITKTNKYNEGYLETKKEQLNHML